MCVCMYACMCVCIYVCVYVYVYLCMLLASETVLGVDNAKSGYMLYVWHVCPLNAHVGDVFFSPKNTTFEA